MISHISVLMTTYNCGKYLEASIQSILSQSFKNFELIIIDDGSNDNTSEVVGSFKDSRIKCKAIQHKGRSNALNIGLNLCSYDWIALMDADDISLPNRLETQVNFLNSNPDCSIVSSWYALFYAKRITHIFELPVNHSQIIEGLYLHSTLCHAGSIYSKKLISEYGGYKDKSFGIDYDLWLRIKDTAIFHNIPEVLILVRVRKNSLHRRPNTRKDEILLIQKEHIISNIDSSKTLLPSNNNLEAWREWFYGDKKKARKFWRCNIIMLLSNFRVLLAYLISFLPRNYFEYVKNLNIKARLNYFLHLDSVTKKKLNSFLTNKS